MKCDYLLFGTHTGSRVGGRKKGEGLYIRPNFYQEVYPNSVHAHSFSVKLSAIWNPFDFLSALSEHTTGATLYMSEG
jgi:hypothetical protein